MKDGSDVNPDVKDIDPQALPVEFTNVVTPENPDVDVVNNQVPEPDETPEEV